MDFLKSNIVIGLGAAAGATLLAPVLLPVLSSVGRPLAKTILRSGMMLYEKSREVLAGAGEVMEDMIAEVRSEEARLATAGPLAGRGSAMATAAEPAAGSNGREPPGQVSNPSVETDDGGVRQ